jgi:pimeloyl-ACP methyl ester carboxylesterase
MDQFGLRQGVMLAEGLGCVTALILAAWYAERVRVLALSDPLYECPADDSLLAQSLRDCPPDWRAVRGNVTCRVVELESRSATLADEVERLLNTPLP